MSGLNLAALANKIPYKDINGNDMESHKIYIRTCCDAHPLAPYYGAVVDLYNSFRQCGHSN
jgi:hypothetical protein